MRGHCDVLLSSLDHRVGVARPPRIEMKPVVHSLPLKGFADSGSCSLMCIVPIQSAVGIGFLYVL